MGDRRGFRYQLEPVQRKCDWDLNDTALRLADLNRLLTEQEQMQARLHAEAQEVRSGWDRQLQTGRLDIALQRVTYDYLAQLQDRIDAQRQRLQDLERERDGVVTHTHRLRKFADNIAKHREDELRQHERRMADIGFKDADDIWLQRTNWRKTT